jgi:hypothetical protein
LCASGNRVAAIAQYRWFAEHLEREFGVGPMSLTRAAIDSACR